MDNTENNKYSHKRCKSVTLMKNDGFFLSAYQEEKYW
jgi:hypothetical protein